MKRSVCILLLLAFTVFVKGQPVFKTIAPQGPVVAGESFRLQYVIEDADAIGNFTPPSFKGFRLVSGPEVYLGQTGTPLFPKQLKNLVYTLEAMEPGRYFLQGAVAGINGENMRSNDILIDVISREEASRKRKQFELPADNATYLKPGEDPYEKIRHNLFMKVLLNKKTCYAGEAIVATFKLYSRLQSKSDIIKNPGFYGFTVQDMINLDDKMVSSEVVNGKLFDVHTIRKVQLYPLQAGTFTVDAMEIKNRVQFSRSIVNRKPEQEIIEGVTSDEDELPEPGTEIFETNMRTAPVLITVRALPVKNKPAEFNGATGRFTIRCALEKNDLSKNEEGYLLVTVKGKGNFSQLVAPAIQWPEGVEGFEPTVIDAWDKNAVPLNGSRTFRYAFVAAAAGNYELPAVNLSFFDPDSNRYKKVSAEPVQLSINNREKAKPVAGEKKISLGDVNRKASWIAAGIVALGVLTMLGYWLLRGKRTKPVIVAEEKEVVKLPEVDEILKQAWLLVPAADKDFYSILSKSTWQWLSQRFELSGTEMNKYTLAVKMKQDEAGEAVIHELMEVLRLCEAGMFTNVSFEEDRPALLFKVKGILEEIK